MKYWAIYDGVELITFGTSSATGELAAEITKEEYDILAVKSAEAREYAEKYHSGEITLDDVPADLFEMFPGAFRDIPEPSDDDEIDDSEALAIITEGVAQ